MAPSISPASGRWQAPDQRQIGAVQIARGEGGGQRVVGKLGLGDDHDAGGVLVQPMHDARPALGADPGEAGRRNGPAMRSPGCRPGCPVPDARPGRPACPARSGRRPRTGSGTGWPAAAAWRGRAAEISDTWRRRAPARPARSAPDPSRCAWPCLDQRLDAGARQRADGVGQETIEPPPARFRCCRGGERNHGGRICGF